MKPDSRRQNFDVDPDQAAELEAVRRHLHASTVKEAVLRAARVVNVIAREVESGSRLMLLDRFGVTTRLVLSDFEPIEPSWRYLCSRPHPWRTQLYIKGRKLLASTVWNDLIANGMTAEEAALDRDLPLEAVLEAIRYCEVNRDLIQLEFEEERTRLLASGHPTDA